MGTRARVARPVCSSELGVRRMPFEFPDEIDPVFVAGEPEESFAMIAASLLLPSLEP